ncbi:DUF1616 domain-containing protein (plasmid) [Halorarum halophilum]|uniref:DUF1616 domain-containing protein n=1 Tax=Halorarum halophilum TaxID=2743090 RepID=A0A7D5KP09_9EURY|nr:DUF1616 domain-containing protein [Halobaculum halophilum]QLG29795.1 DUF1616 domain-containing protein [Halobaculum halophilum]
MTTLEGRARAEGRTIPLDVPLVVLYTVAIVTLVLSRPGGIVGELRALLVLPLLLFLPGYSLLAVLYPGRWRATGTTSERATALNREGISWGERAAISFAASLALIPLLAVLLSIARVPLDPVPITLCLAAVTVLGSVVGVLRRLQLPPGERLQLPVRRTGESLYDAIVAAPTRRGALLNAVLLVAVVAALTGLAYGLVAPPEGGGHTEAALLTEDGEDLVAANYTTEFAQGESAPLVLTVENEEDVERTYTAVVALERVRGSGDNFSVVERQELNRFSMTAPPGTTARHPHTVTPSMRGEDLRLSYYVYTGDAPADSSDAVPEQHLYLWIDVGQGNATESAALQSPRAPGDA